MFANFAVLLVPSIEPCSFEDDVLTDAEKSSRSREEQWTDSRHGQCNDQSDR